MAYRCHCPNDSCDSSLIAGDALSYTGLLIVFFRFFGSLAVVITANDA